MALLSQKCCHWKSLSLWMFWDCVAYSWHIQNIFLPSCPGDFSSGHTDLQSKWLFWVKEDPTLSYLSASVFWDPHFLVPCVKKYFCQLNCITPELILNISPIFNDNLFKDNLFYIPKSRFFSHSVYYYLWLIIEETYKYL